ARFGGPTGIAVDRSGSIYVKDGTVRKISDGQVTTVAGLASAEARVNVDGTGDAARFESSNGVAADGAGNLYVADDHTVRKVTPEGQVTTIAGRAGVTGNATGSAATATFQGVRGIAVDANSNVFVADSDNNAIKKISNGTVMTFAGSNTPLEGDADGPG